MPAIENHTRRLLIDIAIVFGAPFAFVLISNGLDLGQGLTAIFGLMLVGYGALFYFFPDLSEARNHRKKSASPGAKDDQISEASLFQGRAARIAPETPWVDFGAILLLPVAVIATLLYLVWTHTVLGKTGLAVATLAIPVATVSLSWFVIRHQGHHSQKTGKAPPPLLGGLLAFWIAAVFIFVVCLVSWIQKLTM
jgi:hypothetical protein